MEDIEQSQLEMSKNHTHGAIGALVSGVMWLLSGLTAYEYSPKQAVWVLLIGGAFIHPISTVLNKIMGTGGPQSKTNALGKLAMEGTVFMLMCIPLAYGLSMQRTEWFFQAMLMIIGGRYLTFHTLFGNRSFWLLGALLGIAGYVLFSLDAPSYASALTGSIIEISFGLYLYRNARKAKTGNRNIGEKGVQRTVSAECAR